MPPKKKPEDLLKRGRKSTFTQELGDRICALIATNTVGLKRLVQIYDDLPDECTIREWRFMFPKFGTQYAQAKLFQAELLAEECLDIADDGTNDWMASLSEEEQEKYRLNGEHVQRSRLRIDTRKFFASKLLPKKYGDFVGLETDESKREEYKKKREEFRDLLDKKNKKDC